MSRARRRGGALPWVIGAAVPALVWWVSVRQGILFAIGVGMGATLASARFGFATGWRRLVAERDPSGFVAHALLLALAAAFSMPLLGAYPELGAALGPPSVSVIVGAFVFGAAMQVADGCGSGTLYKAGLGVPLSLGVLPLFALGSFLGAAHLDFWLGLGRLQPVGLVDVLGPGLALATTLALLACFTAAVLRWAGAGQRWRDRRLLVGAAALAVLAAMNLIVAGQPWGVVYGFGLWAAKAAVAMGYDASVNAYWGRAEHLERLSQTLLTDVTSITNIGILAGALAVARKAHSGQTPPIGARQWAFGLVAGFAMGYGSRLAFGCNVGALVSGISTGSLHGWMWWPAAFGGTLLGVRVRRHLGLSM